MRILFCIKAAVLVILLGFGFFLKAQTPSVRWEGGFSANHKFNNKWSLNTQLLARETVNDYASEVIKPFTDRMEIKPFLTYALFNQRKLSLGYMFRSIDPFEDYRGVEHRITQQFAFLSNIRNYRIAHRIKIEERIFKEDFILRLRYRFSYDQPLQGESLDPGEWYALLSNEFVLSFSNGEEDWQNRLAFGFGKFFKSKEKLQFSLTHRYSDLLTTTTNQILQFKSVYYFSL